MPADRGNTLNKATRRVKPTDAKYPCMFPGCNVVLSRRNDVKRHELVHTDERGYQCPHGGCEYSVKQKSNLTAHLNKVHLDNARPLGCPVPGCEKSFGDPSARSRHKKKCTAKYCEENGIPLETFLAIAPSPSPSSEAGTSNRKRKQQDPNVPARVSDLIVQESQDPAGDLSQFSRFPLDPQSPEAQGFNLRFDCLSAPELSPSSSTSSMDLLDSLFAPLMPSWIPQTGCEVIPVSWSWNGQETVEWTSCFKATLVPLVSDIPAAHSSANATPAVGSTGYLAGLFSNGVDPALLQDSMAPSPAELQVKEEPPSPVLAQTPLEFESSNWVADLGDLAQFDATALNGPTNAFSPQFPLGMNNLDDWAEASFAPTLDFGMGDPSMGKNLDAYNPLPAPYADFDFTLFQPQSMVACASEQWLGANQGFNLLVW